MKFFLSQNSVASTPKFLSSVESLSKNRFKIIVVVDDKINQNDMKAISTKVVFDTLQFKKDTYGIYINFTDSNIAAIPNNILGSSEFGPGGDAAYDQNKLNAKKELIIKSKLDRDWNKKPTEDDYRLYYLYNSYLSKNLSGNSSSFLDQFVGSKPSVGAVENSFKKVNDWILNKNN